MKYRTYKKIRDNAPFLRRVILLSAIIILMIAFVIATLIYVYDNASATAATRKPEITGTLGTEMFEPLDCKLSEELQEYTYYMCQNYSVDFELAMAVMFTESAFDPEAVSGTGDYGLMQLNEIALPELADKLGITDITDPYQNIRGGVYLLGGYAAKYNDPARVVMAYNMGDYGSSALWEEGVHTTAYTEKVLAKYREFKEANYGKR